MKYKRVICMLLAMIMIMLCGCGGEKTSQESDKFVFTVGKDVVCIGDDASTLEAKFGKPDKYFEAESCAFVGLDKTFTYNGFVVSSSPDDKRVDRITDIYFTDKSVKTTEGVAIGDSTAELERIYGTPESKTIGAITFVKGGVALQFIVTKDTIQGIEYFIAE